MKSFKEFIAEKKNHEFAKKHPYTTAAAIGAAPGAVAGVGQGALGAFRGSKALGLNKATTKAAMKYGMKLGGVIGAATGAATAAIATYGYKVRKKHPIAGGYLSGGIHGAIGSKVHSYSEGFLSNSKKEKVIN